MRISTPSARCRHLQPGEASALHVFQVGCGVFSSCMYSCFVLSRDLPGAPRSTRWTSRAMSIPGIAGSASAIWGGASSFGFRVEEASGLDVPRLWSCDDSSGIP